MEYTTQTPLIVAGRSPSFAERQYWQRQHNGLRRATVWLMVGITAYFAYSAWMTIFYMTFWDAIITALVLLVPTVLTLWFPFYDGHQRENELKTVWYNEQADKKRLENGYTVTLWDDRVVMTDLRGETTVPFSRITLCTETVYGFYLHADTTDFLIRAADLTPEQATAVRNWLQTVIPPQHYRLKSRVMGRLSEALPLSVFQTDDCVVARTAAQKQLPTKTNRLAMARMFVVPLGVIYGTMIAQTVTVTTHYLWDLVLFAAIGMAVAFGLFSILSATHSAKKRTYVALTRDGVAMFEDGCHSFYTWERVKRHGGFHNLTLQFPNGDRMRMPYAQFDDPEAVLYLIKGDSYHG